MEHVLLNPAIWRGANIDPILIGEDFFHTLAYCFYDCLTLTPLLLQWFHATNNSFSIIQFMAHHKWNSKDNAVANEHGRRLWHRGVCQRKDRTSILRLPHIPIKTRKLHLQARCINVIYRLKGDRWWSETLMWQRCAMVPMQPEPMKESSQHHPRPDHIY